MISSPGSRNADPGTPTNQSNFGQSSVGTPQPTYKHPSLTRIQQNNYFDSSSNRSRSNSCAPSSNVNSPSKFQQPYKEPLPHKILPAPSGTIPIETTYAQRMKDGNTALMNPIINPEQTKLPDIFFECPSTGPKPLGYVGFHPDLDVTREARQNKTRIHDSDSDGESVGTSWRGRSSAFDRAIYTTNHNYNFEGVEDASWVKEDSQLVPIHLDLDIGGYRLKDRIIWNLKDDYLTSNDFAAILCHDLNLPLEQFRDQISEAIDEQIYDYKEILDNEVQLNLFKAKEINGATIPITLDIHVDHLHLKDQFDWDPLSDLSPLQFARTLVADLGLGGELTLLIAHSIYGQLFEFYRQFHSMQPFLERNRDLPTDQLVYSMRRQTLANDFTAWLSANPLANLFRDPEEIADYTPQLSTLTTEQAEKLLMEEERKARRRRRGNKPTSGRSLRRRMY